MVRKIKTSSRKLPSAITLMCNFRSGICYRLSYTIKQYWPILGFVVFGIVFIGHSIDDNYFIPICLNNADPTLYPTDLLVNSQSILHSVFFPTTGYLLRYIDLNILFPALYFLTIFAIALLIFHLSLLLFRDSLTAYLTVFLLLLIKWGISVCGVGINPGVFEPSSLAQVFSLWAIYLFLKTRYRPACLLVGLLFYLQGLTAVSVSVMFLFFFLVKFRELPKGQILQSTFLLFLPLLPTVGKLLTSGFFAILSQEARQLWLAIMHFRVFWHLFPFSWGPGDYFNYLGWLLWAFIVLKYAHHPEKHESIIIFCQALALFCLVGGIIFTEIIPVPVIIKMMPWRSTALFVLFLVIYIGNYLVNFPRENLIQRLLVAGTVAALFFSTGMLILCFALLHLAFEVRNKKYLPYLFTFAGTAGIFVFTLGSFLRLESNSFLFNKFLSFANLGMENVIFFYLLFGFMVYFLHLNTGQRMGFSKRQISSLICFLLFLGSIKLFLLNVIDHQDFKRDWLNTQNWAKQHTQVETVLITPPYLEGFRIRSQRGIVVETKDGGIGLFDTGFAFKWWQRLNDLGYDDLTLTMLNYKPKCKRAYNNLNETQLIRLANKYAADYIVTERPRQLNFKLVYQNEHFKVYAINSLVNQIPGINE